MNLKILLRRKITLGIKITNQDIYIFKYIYMLRFMTFYQIYNAFYKTEANNTSYCYARLNKLAQNNYLEKIKTYQGIYCYFLTTKSINLLIKEQGTTESPSHINKIKKKGYFRASELKFKNLNRLDHQIALNDIFLDLNRKLPAGVDFTYIDSKHLNLKQEYGLDLRPDAIIETKDNTRFFVEMDMGTESMSFVKNKFLHYQNYLIKSKKQQKNVILFFAHNSSDYRMESLKSLTVDYLGEFADNYFDVFIDKTENLLEFLTHEYFVLTPSIPKKLIDTLQKSHTIVQNPEETINTHKDYPLFRAYNQQAYNEQFQDFFLEYVFGDSLAFNMRLKNYHYTLSHMKKKIPLVSVCNSSKQIKNICKRLSPLSEKVYLIPLSLVKENFLNELEEYNLRIIKELE